MRNPSKFNLRSFYKGFPYKMNPEKFKGNSFIKERKKERKKGRKKDRKKERKKERKERKDQGVLYSRRSAL